MTSTQSTTTQTVDVSTGVRLEYSDVGVGEPVLLIMGAAGSLGVWGPLEPAVSAHRRALSYDHRGIGASSRGGGEITTASLADDAAALLDARGIATAHVLGWSLGSAVAQELALRHPDRVVSLGLYGTWARLDGFQTAVLGAMRHAWDTGDLESALGALGLCFSARMLNAPDFQQQLESFLPLFPQTTDQARVVAEQWEAVFAHDTTDRLASVAAPTLVISGEEDLVTPRSRCEAVARAIPGAEIVHLDGPGSAHALHLERTDEVAAAVTSFWDRHPLTDGSLR
ncbi:pimeloyl-ACP methyl ester carboxylesterase [Haloactinopolyspora alba]|uniref:Pimeloyl-ACP methyl ester carboxylesterase n=1 Tax=Haloactinopolyspora alba TaxID=648780 RepID=A0A2P8DL55_9ACTN|nr:alpha/beta hydrolase [Haloactinopolyspora alba]PSK97881.1 pimeloyl-ACP methyl ester carboxylesterase [Haloactinopolyspora alba]